MAQSKVHRIEALENLRVELLKLGTQWDEVVQSIRVTIHRAEDYFSQDRVGYWRSQIELAERDLNESKDNLSRKRSAVRVTDRPAATEAAMRVRAAEARLGLCQAQHRQARSLAIEISRQCDRLLGPVADVAQHCDSILPNAAAELQQLITHLRRYADDARR